MKALSQISVFLVVLASMVVLPMAVVADDSAGACGDNGCQEFSQSGCPDTAGSCNNAGGNCGNGNCACRQAARDCGCCDNN